MRSSQDQDKSSEQLRKEVSALRRRVAALQAFKRNLAEVHDRERRSIALEVNDDLAQLAAGAMMHFDTYKALHEHDPSVARNSFDLGLELLAEGIRVARRIVNRLTPPSLEDVGVVAAVTDLVQDARAAGPAAIELPLPEDEAEMREVRSVTLSSGLPPSPPSSGSTAGRPRFDPPPALS